MVDEDGSVIEIISQGSLTSPDQSPDKLKRVESDLKTSDIDDDNDDFGYLVFDEKELANSLVTTATQEETLRHQNVLAGPLSTRSETEEEKA